MHERMIEAFSGSRGWRLGRRQSVRVLQASWTSPETMGLAGRRAYSSNRGMIHLGAVPGWVIDRVPSLGNGWVGGLALLTLRRTFASQTARGLQRGRGHCPGVPFAL